MDNDNDDGLLRRTDLTLGRQTLFCCLCCGVPYAFPDDVYLSRNEEVKSMIYFTHFVRNEMKVDDGSSASTTQWQLNQCHYVHSFMHSTLERCRLSRVSADVGSKQRSWADQPEFLRSCNALMQSLKFAPASNSKKHPLSMTKDFMNYRSPWCNGCNMAATNHLDVKNLMGFLSTERKMLAIPDPGLLPMGMRILHDTYVFIYVMAACIAVMLSANSKRDQTATRSFRLDCLVRLYVGYLLYQLMEKLNAGTVVGDLSFEHWYMLYFNDLQLWEYTQVKEQRPYTNLLVRMLDPRPVGSRTPPLHNFSFSTGMPRMGDSLAIPEILDRVTQIAKEHSYALDIHNYSANPKHEAYHKWLPWKRYVKGAARDGIQDFLSRSAATLAPAPFCCIKGYQTPRVFSVEKDSSSDDEDNDKESGDALPKEFFFHRLYLNTSIHFCSRPKLHKKMKDYLPDLFENVRRGSEPPAPVVQPAQPPAPRYYLRPRK